MSSTYTCYQTQYLAWLLPRQMAGDSTDLLTSHLVDAQVDLAPHQRSLLVCCSAWRGTTATRASERWPKLTVKKIPKMVKDRCGWGHDDYSLNVANLPMAQRPEAAKPVQDDLFGEADA